MTMGHLSKTSIGALLLLLLSSGITRVDAAVISYSGLCDTNCGEIGLLSGQSVSAQFNLNPLGSAANQTLDKTDVISFSLNIGSIVFTSADTGNWDFEAATNALGEVVSFKFLASLGNPASLSGANDSVDLRTTRWFASQRGTCILPPPGTTPSACDLSLTPVFGTFSPRVDGSNDPRPQIQLRLVPEPAPSMLLALGLLALGLTGIRRRLADTALAGMPVKI